MLEPAGGPGDKVFPPSHSIDDNDRRAGAKYAFEWRRRDKSDVLCVLLDSVQSQANRMEEALQSLWVDKRLALPVIEVDLSKAAPDVGRITSLTAPHRVADALLRDSLLGETLFRSSDIGISFTNATTRNAGPLFKVCPTGLIFGIWDSTGPKGGLGAKFARALTSEIVGVGVQPRQEDGEPDRPGEHRDPPVPIIGETTCPRRLVALAAAAFGGLPLVPRRHPVTIGSKRDGLRTYFYWGIWSIPASYTTVRSLVATGMANLEDARARGVFAAFRAARVTGAKGKLSFAPSEPRW